MFFDFRWIWMVFLWFLKICLWCLMTFLWCLMTCSLNFNDFSLIFNDFSLNWCEALDGSEPKLLTDVDRWEAAPHEAHALWGLPEAPGEFGDWGRHMNSYCFNCLLIFHWGSILLIFQRCSVVFNDFSFDLLVFFKISFDFSVTFKDLSLSLNDFSLMFNDLSGSFFDFEWVLRIFLDFKRFFLWCLMIFFWCSLMFNEF